MKFLTFLIFAILGAAFVGGYFLWIKIGSEDGIVLTFTETQIEERLDKKFPITENFKEPLPVPLPVTVQAPEIFFIPDSDRLRAKITAEIDAILRKYEATATFSCGIRYEPSDHSLRLIDPVVEEIETSKLPKKYQEAVNLLATLLAQRYLNDQPVYKLKDTDVKDRTAKLLLKGVEVKDGLLVVKLGL
ncbi:MAG: DUF1439 domain-containing protein [Akkermansiaceae bacterium]